MKAKQITVTMEDDSVLIAVGADADKAFQSIALASMIKTAVGAVEGMHYNAPRFVEIKELAQYNPPYATGQFTSGAQTFERMNDNKTQTTGLVYTEHMKVKNDNPNKTEPVKYDYKGNPSRLKCEQGVPGKHD